MRESVVEAAVRVEVVAVVLAAELGTLVGSLQRVGAMVLVAGLG